MDEKILKLSITLGVAAVVIYLLAQATGGTAVVRIGPKRKSGGQGKLYAQRRWSGERYQPAGVQGPMAQSQTSMAVPLAPIYSV